MTIFASWTGLMASQESQYFNVLQKPQLGRATYVEAFCTHDLASLCESRYGPVVTGISSNAYAYSSGVERPVID